VAKRKKSSAASSEKAAKTETAVADPIEDDAPLTNIPMPSLGGPRPQVAPAAPGAPAQQPQRIEAESKDIPEAEKLRAQSYMAEQQLLAVKEHNLSLRKQVLQLQQQVLELQSKEFDQAKKESESERQQWLNGMGALGIKDGKLVVPKNGQA